MTEQEAYEKGKREGFVFAKAVILGKLLEFFTETYGIWFMKPLYKFLRKQQNVFWDNIATLGYDTDLETVPAVIRYMNSDRGGSELLHLTRQDAILRSSKSSLCRDVGVKVIVLRLD